MTTRRPDACRCPRSSEPSAAGYGERGFTLAMFLIVIAVMSILMGAAVQAVSFQMQRENEAELIFRGEQYVEAIRLYKQKYGRNPMRMKEIWEADPKVIRKKWKDPITDSLDWGVVFVGQGGRELVPGGGPVPTGTPQFGAGAQRPPPQGANPAGATRGPDGEMIGPIQGVYSKSCEESIKVYKGRTAYCDWKFVLEEQQQGGPGGQPGQPVPTPPTGPGGWHPGDPIPTPPPTGTPGGGDDRPPSYGTTPTPGR